MENLRKGCVGSIEELKRFKERLNPKADFSAIFGQEVDPKVHSLLKHEIFQQIPPEFYGQPQEVCLGEMFVPSRKESAIRKRLEGGEGYLPSNRNDSIILLKWLTEIMQKLTSVQDNGTRFDLTQTIYYISFREVIRQITLHCVERGFIVWKLWNAYLSLVNELAEWNNKKEEVMEKNFREERVQTSKKWEERIKKVKAKVFEAKKEAEQHKNTVEELLKQCKANEEQLIKSQINLKESEKKYEAAVKECMRWKESLKKESKKFNECKEELENVKDQSNYYKRILIKIANADTKGEVSLLTKINLNQYIRPSEMCSIVLGVHNLQITKYYDEHAVQTLVPEHEFHVFNCISIERVLVLVYDTCEAISYLPPIKDNKNELPDTKPNDIINSKPLQNIDSNELIADIEEPINEIKEEVKKKSKLKVLKKKPKFHLSRSFKKQQLTVGLPSQSMLVREYY